MTVFTIEMLNLLAGRLYDHSEELAGSIELSTHPVNVVTDLRLARRALHNLAALRFRIGEIADRALTEDGAVIRRDLIHALADAEF